MVLSTKLATKLVYGFCNKDRGIAMAKGKKTGGTPQLGETPKDKLIRVSSECKPDVERFRNLLDNPEIRDVAIHALNDLEAIAKQASHDE